MLNGPTLSENVQSVVKEATNATPVESLNPAASKESTTQKEVTENVQNRESAMLGNALLYRRSTEIRKSTPHTQQTLEQKALSSLVSFRDAPAGNYVTRENPQGAKLEIPIKMSFPMPDGQLEPYQLINLTMAGAEDFTFTAISLNSSTQETVTISRAEFLKQRFLATKDLIVSQFFSDEAAIMQHYIDTLTGDKPTLVGEAFNQAVTEVAKNFGFLTVDDIDVLLMHLKPNVNAKDGATPEEINQAQSENSALAGERTRLMEIFKGKNIADPESTLELFKSLGIETNVIRQQAENYGKDIVGIEKLLLARDGETIIMLDGKDARMDKKLRAQLQDNKEVALALQKIFRDAEKALGQGGPIQGYFDGVMNGSISQQEAQKFVHLLRSGDLDGIINQTNPDLAEKVGETEEEMKRKHRRRDLVKSRLQSAGMVGLAAALGSLFMMLTAGKKE